MNTFSGSPLELGLQHGEELRDEIRHVLGWYMDQWWGMEPQELQDAVRDHARAVLELAPHLGAEMEGIARGAGLEAWQVYALNARTELRANTDALECTSVGVRGGQAAASGALLAQNWDWWNALRGWTRCVRLEPEAGPAMITLIEPGMVGKIGMNALGVGVCLNFLSTPRVNLEGVPVHVLCRLALESSTAAQAIQRITQARRAACATYLIGDAGGEVAAVEVTPSAHTVSRDVPFVAATNTPITGARCMRRAIFERRLDMSSSPLTPDTILAALGHLGVSAPPSDALAVETVHTVLMDLAARTFLVTDGSRAVAHEELRVTL